LGRIWIYFLVEPAVVEVEQPEAQVQETVKPTEPEKVEEAPKEEIQEEQQAPVEEKKEPEQKASLTQNPREFISDEWKVTIKKKKGKRGKYGEEEPEEPVRSVQVTQPKREEPEAKSPTKAKEVQNVVSEQPKKKIIANWGGEEPKKQKEPAAPEEEFPSLGSAPPKKTAPVSQVVEKKKQPVQEPKQTQSYFYSRKIINPCVRSPSTRFPRTFIK